MAQFRLPQLSQSEIEAIVRRVQNNPNISTEGRRMILQSLNAAANPQAETVPFAIASLEDTRRALIEAGILTLDESFEGVEFEIPDELISDIDESKDEGGVIDWLILALLLVYFNLPTSVQNTLYSAILEAYVSAWQAGIRDSAAKYGCTAAIPVPSGGDMAQLESWAREDANSIISTYESEKENQLRSLWQANPTQNAAFFIVEMDAWFRQRTTWKNPSVMLNTVQKAYGYALQRFHSSNELNTKYRLTGPPPVCPICMDLFSLGHVDFSVVQDYPMPIHVNCPHTWDAVSTYQLDCATIWVG